MRRPSQCHHHGRRRSPQRISLRFQERGHGDFVVTIQGAILVGMGRRRASEVSHITLTRVAEGLAGEWIDGQRHREVGQFLRQLAPVLRGIET